MTNAPKRPKRRWVAARRLTLHNGTVIAPGDLLPAKFKPGRWLIDRGHIIPQEDQ